MSWWAASAEGYDAATGVRAAVRYTPQPWGTELEASVDPLPDLGHYRHRAAGGRRRLDRHARRSARGVPASVPFPAASLASFRITTHGNVLVTISLRPGAPPASANATGLPASIP